MHGRHQTVCKKRKRTGNTNTHSENIQSYIGVEFGIEKCAMLIMKSGKQHMTNEMELLNKEKIRTLGEKESYKYLGILEDDTIKQVEMKEKILKECPRKTRKLLETKLYGRSLIKMINTRAAPLVRYSEPFLKWTRELKQMSQRTRKLMTMHKALHPRDDVERLYVSIKERSGLISIENSVNASIQRLGDYIQKRGERLITATRNNTDNTRINRTEIIRKQKWEGK